MEHLDQYVFDELNKMGITPQNSEWRMMSVLSNAIENWIINEYTNGIQQWMVEEYEPARLRFNYSMTKEFPKTFHKFINTETKQIIENDICEAEYEEVK